MLRDASGGPSLSIETVLHGGTNKSSRKNREPLLIISFRTCEDVEIQSVKFSIRIFGGLP
jgi:hypothetical protein